MRSWSSRIALLGATATLLVAAAPGAATAASNPIFKQCQNGGSLTGYTAAQLRHALATLPTTIKEYTSCQDVIQQAISQAAHHTGTGTGSGSGGSFLPTPVIVILVILILAAVTFGALAVRRRRGDGGPGDGGSPTGGPPQRGPGGTTRVMESPGAGGASSEARTRIMPSPDQRPGQDEDPPSSGEA